MAESEDDLFKNRDAPIKTIRLIGCILLLISLVLFFFDNNIITVVVFSLIGLFQIFAAPRVLEWIIQFRNRDLKKDD